MSVRLLISPGRILLPALCAALAAGCATAPEKAAPAPKPDAAAMTIVAEIALQRGDCRTASETYAKAALLASAPVAQRASEVGLACEDLPAAWTSVQRWRELAPRSREAQAMYAAVALKLYRIAEARAAVKEYLRESQPPEAGRSAQGRQGLPSANTADRGLAELVTLLLEECEPPEVFAALRGVVDTTRAPPARLTLLGELALAAYDARAARDYALRAVRESPKDFPANRLLARAYVVLGEPSQAIAAAQAFMREAPQRGLFELADVYQALGRVEDAHDELERLRAGGAPRAEVDRRLAVLAYDSGDLREAQQRFAALAQSGEASESVLMYLSDIAAREGDIEAALAGYGKLADSPLALQAREKAAALLLASHRDAAALALFQGYARQHPDDTVELTVAEAQVLGSHGRATTALRLLDAALQSHPGHPALEYERAIVLEQAGEVTRAVRALERLLAERPDDPAVLNALGYTLADHDLQLPRAQSLIRRALAQMPDNPAVLDSLGWVRLRQGDAAGALAPLQRAYGISHDAQIAAHWGQALWTAGRHEAARKVWAEALARNPGSQSLRAVVARFIPNAK
ncbi:MAG TPA: tetratricopeptide repeat protein [Steroidobacteraceae bacterium]|nr:tetratricopeptide repeat protein [Steroidobacteraceae bacterium]